MAGPFPLLKPLPPHTGPGPCHQDKRQPAQEWSSQVSEKGTHPSTIR